MIVNAFALKGESKHKKNEYGSSCRILCPRLRLKDLLVGSMLHYSNEKNIIKINAIAVTSPINRRYANNVSCGIRIVEYNHIQLFMLFFLFYII